MLILGLLCVRDTSNRNWEDPSHGGHMFRQRNVTFQCKTRKMEQEEELLLLWLLSLVQLSFSFFSNSLSYLTMLKNK